MIDRKKRFAQEKAIRAIELAAKESLSSMEGDEKDKEGMDGNEDDKYEGEEEGYEDDYVGFDDDLLSFGGAKIGQPGTSFLSEAKTSLQYRMKITNTEANAVTEPLPYVRVI